MTRPIVMVFKEAEDGIQPGQMLQVDSRDGRYVAVIPSLHPMVVIPQHESNQPTYTLEEVYRVFQSNGWNWLRNSDCKHLNLVRDHDGKYFLFDRNRIPITLEILARQ